MSGLNGFGIQEAQAAVSQSGAWTSIYASTAYPNGNVGSAFTVPTGANRLLVVAIASTRTTARRQSVSVSYGGKALTLAAGDAGTSAQQHSYLFYLKDADIPSGNRSLSVTISDAGPGSSGRSYYNRVYWAVFTGVDQDNPVTDTRNYNSGASQDQQVGPFNPPLTIAEGDQAIQIVNLARSTDGSSAMQVNAWASGWGSGTGGVDQTYTSSLGQNQPRPTQHMYIRNRNVTTAAEDGSQHTANRTGQWPNYVYALDSMTAMSIKPTPKLLNPPLEASCGLDVTFVIDVSGSIGDDLSTMKAAYIEFADTFLPETPTQISIVRFSNTAQIYNFSARSWDNSGSGDDYWSNNLSAITTAINSLNSSGYTNWDDALFDARQLFPHRESHPDLILFGTDGDPNRIGSGGTSANEATAVAAAVDQAQLAFAAGIRIISLGIGSNVKVNNLISVSGPHIHPPTPVSLEIDVILSSFDELAEKLSDLAIELCAGTCTVYKVIDTSDNGIFNQDVTSGDAVADWEMEVVDMSAGVSLAEGQTNPLLTHETDGSVNFDFSIFDFPSSIAIQETVKDGWTFLGAECFIGDEAIDDIVVDLENHTVSNITFGKLEDIIYCNFYNYPPPTAVQLIYFEAKADGQAILLTWATATEDNNAGFNLYRATSEDGPRDRLNGDTLIPGKQPGQFFGDTYEFVDTAVEPGVQYFYWLEDIDLNGREKSIYGPEKASLRNLSDPGPGSYTIFIPFVTQSESE